MALVFVLIVALFVVLFLFVLPILFSLRAVGGLFVYPRQLKAMFGESLYINRLPIGTPEVLKSFPPQRLRDFYRDHYRADRMAVIVVGDIEVDEGEALVRKFFAALPSRQASARQPAARRQRS